ncbi:hypothetical protein HOY80DRAFT_966066 [Tuber brumale]|nr:hypothetical protein HOY80DRAFT_966066 [Tuber brumale]
MIAAPLRREALGALFQHLLCRTSILLLMGMALECRIGDTSIDIDGVDGVAGWPAAMNYSQSQLSLRYICLHHSARHLLDCTFIGTPITNP